MHHSTFKQKVKEAWNIGGPGLYQEHLDKLENYSKDIRDLKIYMTKIYKTFECDAFYPIQAWHRLQGRFQELTVCDDIPHLGQIITDNGNVKMSFHVYELKVH